MAGGDAQAPYTPNEITDGEWAGWRFWSGDAFEVLAGPFYSRRTPERGQVCAFRAEARHMNAGGFMHGGALMTFADFALFCIADDELQGTGSVTASMNCEFIDSARVGDLVEASGEVVRAGRSLVFVRGTVTTAGRPLLTFSAIVKKVRRG
jgi:uncharacterized protein (TIGR00369 family)